MTDAIIFDLDGTLADITERLRFIKPEITEGKRVFTTDATGNRRLGTTVSDDIEGRGIITVAFDDGGIEVAAISDLEVTSKEKDWESFNSADEIAKDKPIDAIVGIAKLALGAAQNGGPEVLFVSGRREETREATLTWLVENLIEEVKDWKDTFRPIINQNLFLRATGDNRDDATIKLEILEEIRARGFNPILAFDDRQRVVDAFRSEGIRVAQVSPGNF